MRLVRDQLDAYKSTPEPLSGSVLAIENRLNPYEPAGHLVAFYNAIAYDNLLAVARAAGRAEESQELGLPAFALYGQLRASIEAAAWGYWLLVGEKKATRIYRALSVTYGHAEDFEDTLRSLGMDWPAEARIERLQEIAEGARLQKGLHGPPTVSDMLRVVGQTFRRDERGFDALNGWKLCSGMTHGSRPVIYNLSERVAIGVRDEDGSLSVKLTIRVEVVATLSVLALDLIKVMHARHAYLSTHDYAGRLVL